jgi:transcriptional regulator with XRE-family HTH domain
MPALQRSSKPVDRHVGNRVRILRAARGMTQAELAERIGLSAQQLQKYEIGVNRISASRLYDMARVLDADPNDFFDGFEAGRASAPDRADIQSAHVAFWFKRIQDPSAQAHLYDLIRTMAATEARSAAPRAAAE